LAAFVFGTCVGSFLNVVIHRLPRKESVVTPGSHCGCGQPIRWFDNVPVLSWFLLRGRGRCCGRPFSFRYPAVELLTGLLFAACALRHPPAVAAAGWVFLAGLIGASGIDLEHFEIPDLFTLGLGSTGVVLSALVPALHGHAGDLALADGFRGLLAALLGICVGSGLLLWIAMGAEALLRREAMGFGDVLFLGAIGAFCGWQGAVFSLFGGAVVGVIWFGIAAAWTRLAGRSAPAALPAQDAAGDAAPLGFGAQVPFGPMLAVAAAAYFLFFRGPVTAWFAELASIL
jgi:leader peptidase (prepilin peptidase)/N-methyltransferase